MTRKEAIEAIERLFIDSTNEDYPFTEEFDTACTVAIEALKEQPRPKGRWIKTGAISCRCSECKHMPVENYTSYCPNCGADMRSDE